jgi:hypothetical protein
MAFDVLSKEVDSLAQFSFEINEIVERQVPRADSSGS